MLRTILCVAVALFLSADVALAKGKKDKGNRPAVGTIKTVNAADGTITVTVTSKKGSNDRDFTVGDATKITIEGGDATKELTGKAGLKDPAVKEGASIKVTSDASGAVTEIAIGGSYSSKKNK